jgi:hypothetical protein
LPKPLPTKQRRNLFAKQIPGVRKDCGDAGTNVVAADDRCVADENAVDVCDGIEWTSGQDPDDNAGFTRAWSVLSLGWWRH